MTIGQVGKAAGMATSTIRYYESIGILPPPRRRSGMRDYDATIVDQLKVLRFYRTSGISIQTLVALFAREPKAKPTDKHEATLRRIEELDGIIKDARKMKERLRALLDCKCRGDRRKCVIFR